MILTRACFPCSLALYLDYDHRQDGGATALTDGRARRTDIATSGPVLQQMRSGGSGPALALTGGSKRDRGPLAGPVRTCADLSAGDLDGVNTHSALADQLQRSLARPADRRKGRGPGISAGLIGGVEY